MVECFRAVAEIFLSVEKEEAGLVAFPEYVRRRSAGIRRSAYRRGIQPQFDLTAQQDILGTGKGRGAQRG
ncbi:hypothetical protein D3C72_2176860 [compost metagenome]